MVGLWVCNINRVNCTLATATHLPGSTALPSCSSGFWTCQGSASPLFSLSLSPKVWSECWRWHRKTPIQHLHIFIYSLKYSSIIYIMYHIIHIHIMHIIYMFIICHIHIYHCKCIIRYIYIWYMIHPTETMAISPTPSGAATVHPWPLRRGWRWSPRVETGGLGKRKDR